MPVNAALCRSLFRIPELISGTFNLRDDNSGAKQNRESPKKNGKEWRAA